MTSRSTLLLTALFAGILTGIANPSQAQTLSPFGSLQNSQAAPGGHQARQGYVVIYVNAIAGNDTTGDGTQMRPLQTISQALRNANPNTVIVLAPGEYNSATGESFPLQLKAGVTVQGMPGPSQNTVIIRGSGSYLSPSQGLENTTIVAVDRSGLGNVMVVNPHTQGTGVWIEAGNPVLRDNVFAGSGQAGVYIAGAGAPLIQCNYFTENGSAGLVIGGPSQAQVQGNVFEKTGVGIQIAPGAEPRILDNQVVQNQDGIILQANARPVLENNVIARNRRNGLVEFQSSAEDQVLSNTAPAKAEVAALPPTGAVQSRIRPIEVSPPATADTASTTVTPVAVMTPAASSLPPATEATSTPSPVAIAALPPAETAIPSATLVSSSTVLPALPPAETAIPSATLVSSSIASAAVKPSAAEPAQAIPAVASTEEARSGVTLAVVPADPSPSLGQAPAATAGPTDLTALRQRLVTQRQSSPSAANSETSPDAVALTVVPPPATASAEAASTPSISGATSGEAASMPLGSAAPQRGNLAALRSRLAGSQPGSPANLTAEANPTSVPLSVTPSPAVTPSPVIAVARATASPTPTPAPAEYLPLIPAEGSLPASPSADLPGLPQPNVSANVLRVPGPNIPVGDGGGAMPEILLSSIGSAAGVPPAPPARSASLNLHYKVFVNAPDDVTQSRVKTLVPDAFRVRLNGQVMMQAGAFPDQATADAIASNLTQQGLEAKVQYVE